MIQMEKKKNQRRERSERRVRKMRCRSVQTASLKTASSLEMLMPSGLIKMMISALLNQKNK